MNSMITAEACGTALKRRLITLATIGAACMAMGIGPASAVAAVDLYTNTNMSPTSLHRGEHGRMVVELNNRGDTGTSDPVSVKVDLPPNVTSTGIDPGSFYSVFWTCGGTPVEPECTTPFSFPAFAGNSGVGNFFVFVPGALPLEIDADAAGNEGTFPATVTVESGVVSSQENVAMDIDDSPRKFGLAVFHGSLLDDEGDEFVQAGGHPDVAVVDFKPRVERIGDGGTDVSFPTGGHIRDIVVNTPPGLVGDPTATPKCSEVDLVDVPEGTLGATSCPAESQVGYVVLRTPIIGNIGSAVYSVKPPAGLPAQFAFSTPAGIVRLNSSVRSDGDYGLTTVAEKITQADTLLQSHLVLWGNPASPVHDAERCDQLNLAVLGCPGVNTGGIPAPITAARPSTAPEKAFIAMQTNCVQEPVSDFISDKWEDPAPLGDLDDARWTHQFTTTAKATGCDEVPFDPTMDMQPTSKRADSPTGLDVHIHFPRKGDSDPDGLVQAHLKKATVTVPDGVGFNTGIADGLEACTPAQIGMTSAVGAEPIRFDNKEPSCPNASKIGSGEVISPLLEGHLRGEVFLASQKQNPFGSNYAIYVVVREPSILVKLAGKVEPDPRTGQIRVTFDQNPQLPFEDFIMHFYDGPRAALATPVICGTSNAETEFVPWSAKDPEHPSLSEVVVDGDAFQVTSSPAGPCASSKAQLPFGLGLKAGSRDPIAGAHSPFSIQITRPDANQELDRLEISPPPGFIASLKGIPYCTDTQIAAAAGKASGKAEQASPSCPVATQVGTTTVGAGAGPNPFYAPGKLYLAGPYKGATLSVVAVTPAVAGPFDLGNVVVRSALRIDPLTARITAATDQLPRTIEGVPLRIKDIRIDLDRPDWATNPTNCEAMSVDVTAFGSGGAVAHLSNRYQVGGCEKLGFKPKLLIHLKGGTKRGAHPALLATLSTRPGDANIARAAVTLPRSAFLDQSHIRTICTRVQFAANACPQAAIYGYGKATTPLLDDPIQGNVYLRSSNNKLPDLVAALRGVADIEAVGRIDSVNGGIRNTFDVVPDAPFDVFTLRLQGGKKGLVVNSQDLCAKANRATVKLVAQNGRRYDYRPKVIADGCAKAKKGKGAARGHRG